MSNLCTPCTPCTLPFVSPRFAPSLPFLPRLHVKGYAQGGCFYATDIKTGCRADPSPAPSPAPAYPEGWVGAAAGIYTCGQLNQPPSSPNLQSSIFSVLSNRANILLGNAATAKARNSSNVCIGGTTDTAKARWPNVHQWQYNDPLCSGACPPMPAPASRKMGWGEAFLLVTFCGLTLPYFVFGVLFQKYKKGEVGLDVIPNRAFWRELPELVKVRKKGAR